MVGERLGGKAPPCACGREEADGGNTAIRAILTVIKFNCLIKREKWGRHFVIFQLEGKRDRACYYVLYTYIPYTYPSVGPVSFGPVGGFRWLLGGPCACARDCVFWLLITLLPLPLPSTLCLGVAVTNSHVIWCDGSDSQPIKHSNVNFCTVHIN